MLFSVICFTLRAVNTKNSVRDGQRILFWQTLERGRAPFPCSSSSLAGIFRSRSKRSSRSCSNCFDNSPRRANKAAWISRAAKYKCFNVTLFQTRWYISFFFLFFFDLIFRNFKNEGNSLPMLFLDPIASLSRRSSTWTCILTNGCRGCVRPAHNSETARYWYRWVRMCISGYPREKHFKAWSVQGQR